MTGKPSERAVEIAREAIGNSFIGGCDETLAEMGWAIADNQARIALAALIAAGYTQLAEDK